MVIQQEVIDPVAGPRRGYRAPMWLTLAVGASAVAALAVALAALNSSGQLREDLTAFQDEIFSSVEQAEGVLNSTSAGLALLVGQPLVFSAVIDEDVPIVASIPFRRRIDIPINITIPINEVIDTTITVSGPFGLNVPVDVSVPIKLTVPINLTVPIEIDEVIEVDTSTHLDLVVAVEIDLEEAGLAAFVRQMSINLTELAKSLPEAG